MCIRDRVGEWLLNEALAQAALWRMENPDFVISVNVSYIQILQEGFREMVTRIVEESGTCLLYTSRCV